MKKFQLLLFAVFVLFGTTVSAQNYDSVSGATQKVDGKKNESGAI